MRNAGTVVLPAPRRLTLVVFAAITQVGACGADDTRVCDTPAVVTYEGHIASFLSQYCTRCHDSSISGSARNGAPADRNYDTYAGIEPLAKLANKRILEGTMPRGSPIPAQCDTQLFARWVDQGAKER